MRRRLAARLPVWVFAALLTFKAAVPMLASAAAHAQNASTADICSVYGVVVSPAVPASSHGSAHVLHIAVDPHAAGNRRAQPVHEPVPRQHSHERSDHCALTGLAALADGGFAKPPPLALAPAGGLDAVPLEFAPRRDALARWAARMGHGPPSSS